MCCWSRKAMSSRWKGVANEFARQIVRYHRNNATGWSEEIAGRTWYYCSISLRWRDKAKRNDATFCGDENRRRIVEEIKSALPHPVMINTPTLTCN